MKLPLYPLTDRDSPPLSIPTVAFGIPERQSSKRVCDEMERERETNSKVGTLYIWIRIGFPWFGRVL